MTVIGLILMFGPHERNRADIAPTRGARFSAAVLRRMRLVRTLLLGRGLMWRSSLMRVGLVLMAVALALVTAFTGLAGMLALALFLALFLAVLMAVALLALARLMRAPRLPIRPMDMGSAVPFDDM